MTQAAARWKRKTLTWSAVATGAYLVASRKAGAFVPDYGPPDGDGDADDAVTVVHGHAVHLGGGSAVPEAAGAIAAAITVLILFLAVVAVLRFRGQRAGGMVMAGLLAAMLALVVTPVSLTAALPRIGVIAIIVVAVSAVSLAIKAATRQQQQRQPETAPPLPAAWPHLGYADDRAPTSSPVFRRRQPWT